MSAFGLDSPLFPREKSLINPPIYTNDPLELAATHLYNGHIVVVYTTIEPCLVVYFSCREEPFISLRDKKVVHLDFHSYEKRFRKGAWKTCLEERLTSRFCRIYELSIGSGLGQEILRGKFLGNEYFRCFPTHDFDVDGFTLIEASPDQEKCIIA